MPYLPFDLDAKKKVGPCARAAGTETGTIAWGLLDLWEHVWTTKSAVVSQLVVDGCFGPGARVADSLVAFGFLEVVEGGFRVRGAERFLRISKAKSEAGKARASAGSRNEAGQLTTSTKPAPAGQPASEKPALTPSTQHPTPNLRSGEKPPKNPRAEIAGQLAAVYEQERGEPYPMRSSSELDALMARSTAREELARRWRVALRHDRYPRISTLAELAKHWGHFAPKAPVAPTFQKRGAATEADKDQSATKFKPDGDVDFGAT